MDNSKAFELFSSDLDGTLLGNPESRSLFKEKWESIPSEQRPLLCYNTGRFKTEVDPLFQQEKLPRPDFAICAVGTRIYKYKAQESQEMSAFRNQLSNSWDRQKVHQIMAGIKNIRPQPDHCQNSHKSSWFLKETDSKLIDELKERFTAQNIKVTIVYSSGQDLDILPATAGKGSALQWLCSQLKIPLERVTVSGNTGNDTSMFLLNGVNGILVSNARTELTKAVDDKHSIYRADKDMASGVIEGLEHFGLTFYAGSDNLLVNT